MSYFEEILTEAIASGEHRFVTDDIVDTRKMFANVLVFGAKDVVREMLRCGYTFLARVTLDGRGARLWSKTPGMFMENGKVSEFLIKNYATRHGMKHLAAWIDEKVRMRVRPDITEHIVNTTALFAGQYEYDLATSNRPIAMLKCGYTFMGRIRVNREYSQFWSKTPEMFTVGSRVSTKKIREYLTLIKNSDDYNL